MERFLLVSGLLLAASSAWGGELDSLVLEGQELHASLVARPLDSFRDLPPGVILPKNPQLSSDDKFVRAISRGSSQGRLSREGIQSALYARYAAAEKEIGIYGLEAMSDADAERREKSLQEVWAYNTRSDRVRVHRKGLVIVVVWHTGVTAECWEAANAVIAKRVADAMPRVPPNKSLERTRER